MMEAVMKDERDAQIIAGIVVLAVGLVLLVQQLAPSHHLDIGRFWPIALIVIGARKMIETWRKAGRVAGGGVSLIAVGAILLLLTQGIMTIAQSWPLFIIGQGIGLALSGVRRVAPQDGQVSDGR
jgi:hypothetical protein